METFDWDNHMKIVIDTYKIRSFFKLSETWIFRRLVWLKSCENEQVVRRRDFDFILPEYVEFCKSVPFFRGYDIEVFETDQRSSNLFSVRAKWSIVKRGKPIGFSKRFFFWAIFSTWHLIGTFQNYLNRNTRE